MPNPLYSQLNGNKANNNLLHKLIDFKKGFSGDPQQMIQNMVNSGRISQEQVNQYAQQANQIYNQFKGLF